MSTVLRVPTLLCAHLLLLGHAYFVVTGGLDRLLRCAYIRYGARRCVELRIPDVWRGSAVATEPVAPPEAALIRQRRKDRLPVLSVRDAAAAATAAGVSMSEAGWRSIEAGRYDGPKDKLAIMAQVVGVSADELAELGRRHGRVNVVEAARLLESHVRQRAAAEPAVVASPLDTESAPEQVLQMILKGIDAIRSAEGLTEGQKSSLEKSLMDAVMQSVGGQIVQVRTTLEILGEKSR